MPEAWTLHHEKHFIERLRPSLLPGYRAGLALRWWSPAAEPRRLLTEDERIEMQISVTERSLRLESTHA